MRRGWIPLAVLGLLLLLPAASAFLQSGDLTVGWSVFPREFELEQGPFQGIVKERPTGSEFVDATGLVLSYNMEDLTSGGEMRDFSGQGSHGTIVGANDTDGLFGRARDFDGIDDGISFSDVDMRLNSGESLSVFFWINTTMPASVPDLIEKVAPGNADLWSLRYGTGSPDTVLMAQLSDGTNSVRHIGTTSVNDGTWRNVGFTYTASTGKAQLYVDAVAEPPFFNIDFANIDISIPGVAGLSAGVLTGVRYDGAMDDAVVFKRVPSQAEITFLATHRNYTFRFNTSTEVPADLQTGPTWVRGRGVAMGAAVNNSTTLFTLNTTWWELGIITWESYTNLSVLTVRYNFTFPVGTYPLFANGVFQQNLVSDSNGNLSFVFTGWTANSFELGFRITSSPGLLARVGLDYAYQGTTNQNDTFTAWTLITAPSWISINATGFLTGLPPAGSDGNHAITIQAASNESTAQQSYTLLARSVTPEEIAIWVGLVIWIFFIGIGMTTRNEYMLTLAGLFGVVYAIFLLTQFIADGMTAITAWGLAIMPFMASVLFIYMGLFNTLLGKESY